MRMHRSYELCVHVIATCETQLQHCCKFECEPYTACVAIFLFVTALTENECISALVMSDSEETQEQIPTQVRLGEEDRLVIAQKVVNILRQPAETG